MRHLESLNVPSRSGSRFSANKSGRCSTGGSVGRDDQGESPRTCGDDPSTDEKVEIGAVVMVEDILDYRGFDKAAAEQAQCTGSTNLQ
jgi:hypothetical protein